MKKVLFSTFIFFAFANVNAQLLQSVVMNIGTSTEAHYSFYDNGLLKDKRKADGTLLKEFVYDDQQRVVALTTETSVMTFTYDNQDHVASINGNPLYFYPDSGSGYDMYSTDPDITDSNTIFTYYQINGDMSLHHKWTNVQVDADDVEIMYQMYAGFNSDNNVPSLWDGEMAERGYRYLNVSNPMRQACLQASKVAYFASGTSFEDALVESQFVSSDLDAVQGYSIGEDPETFQHLFEMNDDGHPIKRYDRFCYMGAPEGNYSLTTTYTYQ